MAEVVAEIVTGGADRGVAGGMVKAAKMVFQ